MLVVFANLTLPCFSSWSFCGCYAYSRCFPWRPHRTRRSETTKARATNALGREAYDLRSAVQEYCATKAPTHFGGCVGTNGVSRTLAGKVRAGSTLHHPTNTDHYCELHRGISHINVDVCCLTARHQYLNSAQLSQPPLLTSSRTIHSPNRHPHIPAYPPCIPSRSSSLLSRPSLSRLPCHFIPATLATPLSRAATMAPTT
jgi:hypothetical protein